MKSKKYSFDVAVVGGGSAGMACALKVSQSGLSVVILERDSRLGGILNQCIHNGFGLNYFKEELTGPEYAQKFIEKVRQSNIDVLLNTTVLKIDNGFKLTCINNKELFEINSKAIIFATGCKERPAGAINLCGTRPAGVINAGSAQKIVNIYGKMIGKNIVIVGSGDIGLIMARRLRFEGANVLGVYEVLPYPSGLKRNIVQCLEDYNIPLHLSKTVFEVVGKDRVEGVWVAPVKQDFTFDMSKKEFIKCDCVVLSIGLVPEYKLAKDFNIEQNKITNGAVVDEYLQTNIKGIFFCGNCLHVHDIVDNVTKEAEKAGENCSKFVLNQLQVTQKQKIICGNGLRYVNPSYFYNDKGVLSINFRVNNIYKNADIVVLQDKELRRINKKILLPAEMETVILSKENIDFLKPLKVIIEEKK